MDDRCMYCGELLVDNYESGWHDACIREFFQLDTIPHIDITKESLLAYLCSDMVDQTVFIPGVQQKLSLHLTKDADKTYRFTLVGRPQGYILKPASEAYAQLPEIESLTMQLAKMFGISTVLFGLIRLPDNSFAYISKRMDRVWKGPEVVGKISMEDFCQLSGMMTEDKYRSSYEKCARIIKTYSVQTGLDLSEFFIRLVFSFITGNSDMHLKNFSLVEQSWGWVLSPAYDLLNTNLLVPDDSEEMALTLNGKKRRLKREDFIEFGRRIGVPQPAIQRVLTLAEEMLPAMIRTVDNSLLSSLAKERYVAIMRERLGRLIK